MTDRRELISIIMPAFNAQATIAASIESVLAQTWQDWELIVVIDAASDDTARIVHGLARQDARLRVVDSPVNQGVAASRNIGLDLARGDYIAFLDADDLWLPAKLDSQLAFMRTSGAGTTYTAYTRFDESGPLNTVVPPESVSYRELLKGNVIPNLTSMVRRDAVGTLRFRRVGHEDYVFWLAVLSGIDRAFRLPSTQPAAQYRVHSASLSASKLRGLRWQWHIYRAELRLSLIHSTYLMAHYAVRALRKRSTRGAAGRKEH